DWSELELRGFKFPSTSLDRRAAIPDFTFQIALLTSCRREQTRVILMATQPDFRVHKSQTRAEIGRFGAARRACPESSEGIS
ncbi:MAG: hypothetical protein WB995_09200, partial [Candidatus Acidiferrales bacterium]